MPIVRTGSKFIFILALAAPFAAVDAAAGKQANADCDTGRALRDARASGDAQQMQQHMTRMHELMHRIQTTRDPAERERLEQEQAQLIQQRTQTVRAQHSASMGDNVRHQGLGATGARGPDAPNGSVTE